MSPEVYILLLLNGSGTFRDSANYSLLDCKLDGMAF